MNSAEIGPDAPVRDIVVLFDLAYAASREVGFQWYAYAQTVTGDERERAFDAHVATEAYRDQLPLGDDDDAKDELIRLRSEWTEEARRVEALRA